MYKILYIINQEDYVEKQTISTLNYIDKSANIPLFKFNIIDATKIYPIL